MKDKTTLDSARNVCFWTLNHDTCCQRSYAKNMWGMFGANILLKRKLAFSWVNQKIQWHPSSRSKSKSSKSFFLKFLVILFNRLSMKDYVTEKQSHQSHCKSFAFKSKKVKFLIKNNKKFIALYCTWWYGRTAHFINARLKMQKGLLEMFLLFTFFIFLRCVHRCRNISLASCQINSCISRRCLK